MQHVVKWSEIKKKKKITVLCWLKERYNINIYTHFFFFFFTRIRWNNSDTPLILSCVWVAVMADKSSISYRRTRATIYSILYTDIWWKIGLEKYSKILKRKFLIELERKKLGWKYIYLFKTLFSQTMKIIFNTLSWCLATVW